eukprot:g141.t1
MASSSYYNNNNNLKELERITSSVNDALLPSGFLEEEENNNNHVVCGVMSIITFIWLVIFCVTGVGLGLCYEFLEIHSLHHAPGAASDTFFLCLIGYWSQALVGFLFAFTQKNPMQGAWTNKVILMLVLSSIFDGLAQGLDFIGQVQGGYMLFTIFHSSVTLFSCIIAVFVVQAKISSIQWFGILLVILGLFATAIPNPIAAPGEFSIGLVCSLVGSFFLAASYPFSEKVFRIGRETLKGPVKEETACFFGALINAAIYTIYTFIHTIPRWQNEIVDYIKPGNTFYVILGYVLYGILVGLHSLSFWKSVNKIGTVPTAVAKGAQQAGVFIVSHIVYCSIDKNECMFYNHGNTLWNKMQKSVAAILCVIGVVVYAMSKKK